MQTNWLNVKSDLNWDVHANMKHKSVQNTSKPNMEILLGKCKFKCLTK